MDEYQKIIGITSTNTQFDIVNDFELTRNKLVAVLKDKQGGQEGGKVYVITTSYSE